MEPVGLRSSSFAHSRTSGDGESRGSPTSGVPPTESRRVSKRTGRRPGSAAGDGRQDDDLVAVPERGVEPTGEAHVLVVDVDVDEPPQVAALDEAALDAGVATLEVVDERAERRP